MTTTADDSGARAQDPCVLLIANRTCPCPDVLEIVGQRAGPEGRVHVVAPALNGRLQHYASDVDHAVSEARDRLGAALQHLRDHGVEATGEVGDSDPLDAAADAVRSFPANEIVVSTYPRGQSNWLERNLPERLKDRLQRPVTHLVSHFGLPAEE